MPALRCLLCLPRAFSTWSTISRGTSTSLSTTPIHGLPLDPRRRHPPSGHFLWPSSGHPLSTSIAPCRRHRVPSCSSRARLAFSAHRLLCASIYAASCSIDAITSIDLASRRCRYTHFSFSLSIAILLPPSRPTDRQNNPSPLLSADRHSIANCLIRPESASVSSGSHPLDTPDPTLAQKAPSHPATHGQVASFSLAGPHHRASPVGTCLPLSTTTRPVPL